MADSKVFSLSEVSLHSSKKDCWLIINGKVYDVTGFLEDHPGGEDVLIEASGADATQAFEDVGHSSTASSMLTSYKIGTVETHNSGGFSGSKSDMFKEVGTSKSGQMAVHEKKSSSLVISLLPLIIIGLAFGVWYFLQKA